MKPSWSEAPEWANYLTQDEDGQWYWFEKKPRIWGGDVWWAPNSQFESASILIEDESWKQSLEERQQ